MTDNQELTKRIKDLFDLDIFELQKIGIIKLMRKTIEELYKENKQLTQTQQALDRAVEALESCFYSCVNKETHTVSWWEGYNKAKAALASINNKETNDTAIVENNLI